MISERGGGRETERKRNIKMRGTHGSVASHMRPDQGPTPQPRHVPLWFTGRPSNRLGPVLILKPDLRSQLRGELDVGGFSDG